MNLKHWLHGLIAASIGGGANAVTVIIVDPLKFNLQDGWKNLLTATIVSGVVSAALYLKQSPLPPDDNDKGPYTPSGGLAMIFLLMIGLSGCATQPNGLEQSAHDVASWVAQRSGFIENAVSAITQIAVYASDKDTIERTNTLLMIHGIASNLNALVNSGNVDSEAIRNAFKINESYFIPVLNAVVPIIQNEIITFKENGYGDATIEILKAVLKGISDGSAK